MNTVHHLVGSKLTATTRVMLQALVVGASLTLCGCERAEPSNPTTPTTPATRALELVTVYPTSVTEPSGLAYARGTGALYMISDGFPNIYQIDTTGKVLNTLPIGATDLEGIAVTATADTFYVVEETASTVSAFLPNGTRVRSFPVNVWTDAKHKLEGITLAPDGHLMVLNEKVPMMMLEFAGTTEVWRRTLTYSSDVSDICYDPAADCYWIVSDESQKVLKLSRGGDLLGEWSTPVNQGEGIAIIGTRLYIVSDADAKFYVFVKPQ